MTYSEAIKYLYESAPLFQNIGAGAYKEGLHTTRLLDEHFGHPHTHYRTLHVAGTNGKGSCSHTLAAILQSAGYRTGLFTSPHLVDFRERIRVNGVPIEEDYVTHFIERERTFFEPLHPSFFELTTAMALRYFADKKVDVAVIEVGLGGRLDCTNIIAPDVSIITNISFDHMQFLGNTLPLIAGEKAGIIKPHTPVVVGEWLPQTRGVFEAKAHDLEAPLHFAQEEGLLVQALPVPQGGFSYETRPYGSFHGELGGLCQEKNTATLLSTLAVMKEAGYNFSRENVQEGFAKVCEMTGLMGRWQRLQSSPTVVCDTGHNIGGFTYISQQLKQQTCQRLRIVFGMVADKDIRAVLATLPQQALYYFTNASVQRAMPAHELMELALQFNLHGHSYPTVQQATEAALREASPNDFIYIGGSSFIVADLLREGDFAIS